MLPNLFRRAVGGRGSAPEDICNRLLEDLNALIEAGQQGAAGTTVQSEGALSSTSRAGGEQRAELVSEDIRKQLQAILEALEAGAERAEKAGQSSDREVDSAVAILAQFLSTDLPTRLVECLRLLEFEARKDVISVFSAIVRLGAQVGAEHKLQEYALTRPRFFHLLVEGYAEPEIATHCGMMLRSCARDRRLVEAFLAQPEVPIRLLTFTRHESFDISSDAFSCLRDMLLTHKQVSAAFLEANFQEFFKVYNGLLQSDDYVTQRQALKLLSDMLLERVFMRVMLEYIGDEQFLQIHMNLLNDDSKAIQYEAFHVFKIFVINPQKPPRIQLILYKNKERLVKLLEILRPNRSDDGQFDEDRNTVVGKLQVLEMPARAPASQSQPPSTAALPPPPPVDPAAAEENNSASAASDSDSDKDLGAVDQAAAAAEPAGPRGAGDADGLG